MKSYYKTIGFYTTVCLSIVLLLTKICLAEKVNLLPFRSDISIPQGKINNKKQLRLKIAEFLVNEKIKNSGFTWSTKTLGCMLFR